MLAILLAWAARPSQYTPPPPTAAASHRQPVRRPNFQAKIYLAFYRMSLLARLDHDISARLHASRLYARVFWYAPVYSLVLLPAPRYH